MPGRVALGCVTYLITSWALAAVLLIAVRPTIVDPFILVQAGVVGALAGFAMLLARGSLAETAVAVLLGWGINFLLVWVTLPPPATKVMSGLAVTGLAISLAAGVGMYCGLARVRAAHQRRPEDVRRERG
jgi:hypothetical protein